MISKVIQTKILRGEANLYRRVSSKEQAKGDYSNQLASMQSHYPGLTVTNSTNISVKEVISGRSDVEVRIATGLGKCQRHLKRNPSEILLVSDHDRISRRADLFELIQRQGLGGRIYEASTGMTVDDAVNSGRHRAIERQTNEQQKARQIGLARYTANGGTLGSVNIAERSRRASEQKARMTEERKSQVLTVISKMTYQGGGRRPPLDEICDVLDQLEIRTGQNRIFDPARLSQFGKYHREEWIYAFDSYYRPRRRIRELVRAAQTEIRNRRRQRCRRIWLASQTTLNRRWPYVGYYYPCPAEAGYRDQSHQSTKTGCDDGCRDPPTFVGVGVASPEAVGGPTIGSVLATIGTVWARTLQQPLLRP